MMVKDYIAVLHASSLHFWVSQTHSGTYQWGLCKSWKLELNCVCTMQTYRRPNSAIVKRGLDTWRGTCHGQLWCCVVFFPVQQYIFLEFQSCTYGRSNVLIVLWTIEPLFCGYGYLMSTPICVIGDQDEVLRRAVQWHKGKNWKKIGELSWP
jgi:hypothetical protein